MRRNLTVVLLVLAVTLFFDGWKGLWPSVADEPAPKPLAPANGVAIMDLAKVFNNHKKFKKLSDSLRRDVEQAERDLTTHKAEMQAAADALAKLTKGSAEAKQLESKITRDSAELQVKVQEQKKEFFEQEAGIYWDVYQEVMKEVEKLADARGISLVMRFNGDPMDPNDPQAIQKELNKAILFHKGIDITDDILRIVNAQPEA